MPIIPQAINSSINQRQIVPWDASPRSLARPQPTPRGLSIEGFDTRDLKEAKALLEELGAQ